MNSAIALAARLKAVGVESIMAERNAKVGDNWTLRYDSLKFHVPTSFCELPFMSMFISTLLLLLPESN